MNSFIKKLIILVIVFLILIPSVFYAKYRLDKKNNSKTKIELEKKEDKKSETTEKDTKKTKEKKETKRPKSQQLKDKIRDLEAEIKSKNEELEGLQKLVDKEEQEDQEEQNNSKKSFVKAYDALEVRNNMENPDYKGKKIAFLTFDDGVNTTVTNKILKTLKDNKINATFFIPGFNLENESSHEVLKRLYADGNSIATHSYSHDYDILYPNRIVDYKQVLDEQHKTVKLLKSILGKDFDTKIFRYPGGHMSWDKESIKKSDEELEKIGVRWIDWNSMTGDAQPVDAGPNDISRPKNVDEVISNFEQSLNYTANPNQVVILMHDALGKDLTADALQSLIDHLKAKGYEFGILK